MHILEKEVTTSYYISNHVLSIKISHVTQHTKSYAQMQLASPDWPIISNTIHLLFLFHLEILNNIKNPSQRHHQLNGNKN